MIPAEREPISRIPALAAAGILALSACPAGLRGAETAALPLIDPDQAAAYAGRMVEVEGKILSAQVVRSGGGRHCVLGFGPSIRQGLTVAIYPRVYGKMARRPEVFFRNRIVRVRGTVSLRDGQPRILLSSPGRLKRVAGDGEGTPDTDDSSSETNP